MCELETALAIDWIPGYLDNRDTDVISRPRRQAYDWLRIGKAVLVSW